MKSLLNCTSLFRKITYKYFLMVFIPVLVVYIYTHIKIDNYNYAEIINEGKSMIEQAEYNLKNKTDMIESISNNICYNSKLQSFLDNDFQGIYSLEEYRNDIFPYINYAIIFQKVNIKYIRVYMVNDTIPEGFDIFYNINRIEKKGWYKQFIQSEKNSVWIVDKNEISDDEKETYTPNNGYATVMKKNMKQFDYFTYVQKVRSLNGEFLGVVSISIPKKELLLYFKNFVKYNEDIFIVDENSDIIYVNANKNVNIGNIIKKINKNGYFLERGKLYVYKKINPLNISVIMVMPVVYKLHSMKFNSILFFLFSIGGIIMLLIFYKVLRKIFSKINKNISFMDQSIQNNFKLRLPVCGEDEISQIARNFNILLNKIDILVDDIVKKEIANKEAQFKILQQQINPHFIYNTLDIFSGKMELYGHYEESEAIVNFARMLRYNINNDESLYTSVLNEIKHVKNYLSIQRLRYDEQINLMIDISDEIKNMKIIKFILQPIIENSIVHGYSEGHSSMNIKISFKRQNENVKIVISDNGKGMDEKQIDRLNQEFIIKTYKKNEENNTIRKGIGLRNINERLKLYYGDKYHLKLESIKGKYTKVFLKVRYLSNI